MKEVILSTKIYCCIVIVLVLFMGTIYSQQVPQIDPEYRMGLEYERMGDFERALEVFRNLVSNKPGFSPYEQGVERNLKNLKRYNDLIVLLQVQFVKNPTDVNILGKIADVYVKWGKIDTARYYFTKILEQGRNNPFLYSFLANILIQNRMFNEAITLLQDARKKLNDPDLFHYDLAQLYGWYRNFTASTGEYLQIITKDPNSYPIVEKEVMTFPNDSTTVSQVLNVLSRSVGVQPNNIQYHQLIANFCLRNALYEISFRHYIELDKLTSGDGNQVFQFANLVFQQEEYSEAINAYDYVIKHYSANPQIFDAEFRLALSYEKSGIILKSKFAREDKNSIRDSQDSGSNYLLIAIKHYQQIINKNPGLKWIQNAFYRIGEIQFYQLYDNDEALRVYTSAYTLDPKNTTGRFSILRIGDCYVARGDLKEAWETYRLALTSDESQKDAVYYQARLKMAEVRFYEGHIRETKVLVDSLLLAQVPSNNVIYNDILTLSMFLEEHSNQDSLAVVHYARGEALVKQHHLSEAVNLYTAILKEFSDQPLADDCLFRIGELEVQMGNPEEGIKQFQALLERHPESYLTDRALKRIGEIYANNLHRPKEAQQTFEMFLVRYPKSIFLDDIREEIRRIQHN